MLNLKPKQGATDEKRIRLPVSGEARPILRLLMNSKVIGNGLYSGMTCFKWMSEAAETAEGGPLMEMSKTGRTGRRTANDHASVGHSGLVIRH